MSKRITISKSFSEKKLKPCLTISPETRVIVPIVSMVAATRILEKKSLNLNNPIMPKRMKRQPTKIMILPAISKCHFLPFVLFKMKEDINITPINPKRVYINAKSNK